MIHAPWMIGSNNDYDDEIWTLIFLEEGIVPVDGNEKEEEYEEIFD